jgi:hypothetical protein
VGLRDEFLVRFLVGACFNLFDQGLPILVHPRRILEAVKNIGTVGALKLERGANYLLLVVTCFSQ